MGRSDDERSLVPKETIANRQLQLDFLKFYYLHNKQIAVACQMVGIQRSTYQRWLSEDFWFREQKFYVDEQFVAALKARAFEIAQTGADPEFLLDVIEREDPLYDKKLRHIAAMKNPHLGSIGSSSAAPIEDPFAIEDKEPIEITKGSLDKSPVNAGDKGETS